MDILEEVLDQLCSFCKHSFGPCGEHVLLHVPPDPTVITSHGYTVWSAFRRDLGGSNDANPLLRWILDAQFGFYKATGDGTTAFMLLLRAMIKRIACECKQKPDHSFATRVQLTQAMQKLQQAWRINDVPVLHNISIQDMNDVLLLTQQVLQTALTGMFSPSEVHVLVQLVLSWVFRDYKHHQLDGKSRCITHLRNRINGFLSKVRDATIFMPSASRAALSTSQILAADDFLLRKSLVEAQRTPKLLQQLLCSRPIRFLCLQGSLRSVHGSNAIDFHASLSTRSQLETQMQHLVRQYVQSLTTQHQIQLILSSEAIEDDVAAVCTEYDIACVQLVEWADLIDLCALAGISLVTSVYEPVDPVQHVGVCGHGIRVLRLNQQDCLYFHSIERPERHDDRIQVPQLLLRAATKGIYQQYYEAMQKCLRVLLCLYAPDHEEQQILRVCSGGGATELALAQWFRSRATSSTVETMACRIVAESLEEVVATLRTNMSQHVLMDPEQKTTKRSGDAAFLHELAVLRHHAVYHHGYVYDHNGHKIQTSADDCTIAMASMRIKDPFPHGIMHPWNQIETMLQCVLNTCIQLLRIDIILPITGRMNTT